MSNKDISVKTVTPEFIQDSKFKILDIAASGFDLIIKTESGEIYRVNNGLSKLLLNELNLTKVDGSQVTPDEVISKINKGSAGLESEYIANALISISKGKDDPTGENLGSTEAAAENLGDQATLIEKATYDKEILELERQIAELRVNLAQNAYKDSEEEKDADKDAQVRAKLKKDIEALEAAIADATRSKSDVEKLSQKLGKKGDITQFKETVLDDSKPSVNIDSGKSTVKPTTQNPDEGNNYENTKNPLLKVDNPYEARAFYVQATLSEESQITKIVNGQSLKIPTITTVENPLLVGSTFGKTAVTVKLGKIKDDFSKITGLTVPVDEKGSWELDLSRLSGEYGDYKYIVEAVNPVFGKASYTGIFKKEKNLETMEFTANFAWELLPTGEKIFKTGAESNTQLVGESTPVLQGRALPGSRIIISDKILTKQADGTFEISETYRYVINIPKDKAPNGEDGLTNWSFAFNGNEGHVFKNGTQHRLDITNDREVGDSKTLDTKIFEINSEVPEADINYTGIDTYGYDATRGAIDNTPGALRGFVNIGLARDAANDSITQNVDTLVFIGSIDKGALSEDTGTTVFFDFNGQINKSITREDLINSNLIPNADPTKEYFKIILPNTADAEGSYSYKLVISNRLKASQTILKNLVVDKTIENSDLGITSDTDTFVKLSDDGFVIIEKRVNSENGQQRVEEELAVSNSDVKFITTSDVDGITTNNHPTIKGNLPVEGDVVRLTLRNPSRTNHLTEPSAEDPNASTNRVFNAHILDKAAYLRSINLSSLYQSEIDPTINYSEEELAAREKALADFRVLQEESYQNYLKVVQKSHQVNQYQPNIHTVYFTVDEGVIKSVPGKRPLTEDDKDRLKITANGWEYELHNKLDFGVWKAKIEIQDKAGNVKSGIDAEEFDINVQDESVDIKVTIDGKEDIDNFNPNPNLVGSTEPNAYIVVTTVDEEGRPVIFDAAKKAFVSTIEIPAEAGAEDQTPTLVDVTKAQASRAILADNTGKWIMPYITEGELSAGGYYYTVTAVKSSTPLARTINGSFIVREQEDTTRILGPTELVKYTSDGYVVTENGAVNIKEKAGNPYVSTSDLPTIISNENLKPEERYDTDDKSISGNDIEATKAGTNGLYMAVFKGKIVSSIGKELDTSINIPGGAQLKIIMSEDGSKFKIYRGDIIKGEWFVGIPLSENLDDGIYAYENIISTGGGSLSQRGTFLVDQTPSELDFSYVLSGGG